MIRYLLLIATLFFQFGCASSIPKATIINCVDDSPKKMIQYEVTKRFNNPVIVICHGGMNGDEWTAYPDHGAIIPVKKWATILAQKYPNRDIVLWMCNEYGKSVHVPRVWFFTSRVWQRPDSTLFVTHETKVGDGYCGSIWEAITKGY